MQRVVGMSSEGERGALDALAADLLRTVGGLEFRAATTPEEVDATFRLRYEAVVENGWAGPGDYPDGRERDADDERAVCVVCLDGGRIVGSLRLVKPPCPTGSFRLSATSSSGSGARPAVVDAGRVVVARLSSRALKSHLVLTPVSSLEAGSRPARSVSSGSSEPPHDARCVCTRDSGCRWQLSARLDPTGGGPHADRDPGRRRGRRSCS